MSSFRVEVTANSPPSVCVDFDQDHEPTEEEIEHAVNELASEVLSLDAYLAEHCVESGYIVTSIERYG